MDQVEQLRARWRDAGFVASARPLFRAIFDDKRAPEAADLRGIIVGLDGAPAALTFEDFQNLQARALDLSFSRLSCSFTGALFQGGSFIGAELDTCRLKHASFEACNFSKTEFYHPTLDDAVFTDCRLVGAMFVGRLGEYGGRRTTFQRCLFDGVTFRQVSLRACRFIGCQLAATTFERVVLHGTTFVNGAPAAASFRDCAGNAEGGN